MLGIAVGVKPIEVKKTLIFVHRWMGVGLCLLFLLWFASGIVMMYVGLPRVTDEERARTLEPIAWQACCRFPPRLAPDNAQLFGAQVENVAGAPVPPIGQPMRARIASRALKRRQNSSAMAAPSMVGMPGLSGPVPLTTPAIVTSPT